jgi:hypothetical protein
VVVEAVFALLAPPRDEEQAVVDRQAEPDEADEELDDEGHLGDRRQAEHDEERREDRDCGDQHRQQRQQRGEHEREDDQRASGAEQRLGQDSGTIGVVAGGQLLLAGDAGLPAGQCARDGRLQVLRGVVGERLRHRGEDDRDRRAFVAADEPRVVRVGVVDDARPGDGLVDRRRNALQSCRLVGGPLAVGRRHHGDARDALRGVRAVELHEVLGGLVAGLARQREVDRQSLLDAAGRGHPRDEDDEPADHHPPTVMQHERR